MITLYSYPELFGVADNNGYGLKVFAFLRLNGVRFKHEHVFDASAAPRGQLPYIVDDSETIGDSDTIIAHVITKYRLTIDATLTSAQRDMSHQVNRMLDDLYWVMSYSRWKDERFWPAFRDALVRQHPSLTEDGLRKAQEFNLQRYYFQGIGRYTPDAAYARGLADLRVLADLIPAKGYVQGEKPTSIDAGIYGFMIISGTTTENCCHATARDAMFNNYKVVFLSDATGSFDYPDVGYGAMSAEEVHRATLCILAFSTAHVMTVDELKARVVLGTTAGRPEDMKAA
jgi:Glutathione S-transferase N-terminal domain/Isochorismatase family